MKPATVHHWLWTGVLALGLALGLTACAPKYYPPQLPPTPRAPVAPPPQAVVRPVFYIKANRLNLRACPGMDCPKVSVLERGEEVEKVGASEDWFQIRVIRDGRLGWVDSKYLSSSPVTQAPEAAPATPAVPTTPPAEVTPPPLPERIQPPPLPEKPTPPAGPVPPTKPPAVEKPPKPAKPGEEVTPPAKKKPEEVKPAKPAKPEAGATEPAPKPEKPAKKEPKPAPKEEKPAPAPEPAPESGGKIRIM